MRLEVYGRRRCNGEFGLDVAEAGRSCAPPTQCAALDEIASKADKANHDYGKSITSISYLMSHLLPPLDFMVIAPYSPASSYCIADAGLTGR